MRTWLFVTRDQRSAIADKDNEEVNQIFCNIQTAHLRAHPIFAHKFPSSNALSHSGRLWRPKHEMAGTQPWPSVRGRYRGDGTHLVDDTTIGALLVPKTHPVTNPLPAFI